MIPPIVLGRNCTRVTAFGDRPSRDALSCRRAAGCDASSHKSSPAHLPRAAERLSSDSLTLLGRSRKRIREAPVHSHCAGTVRIVPPRTRQVEGGTRHAETPDLHHGVVANQADFKGATHCGNQTLRAVVKTPPH